MLKRRINPLAEGYDYEVDTTSEQAWYQLLRGFEDSNINQTLAYAAEEEGRGNISTLKLTRNGEVVGIALARFRRVPVLGIGLAYVHRGPIWRRTGTEANVENFRQVVRALRNEFVCKRGLTLRLNPAVYEEDTMGLSAVLGEEGFIKTPHQTRGRTIVMDLTPSLDLLRQGMGRNWKRNLKQDEENHLEIIEGSDKRLFDDFVGVYQQMITRKSLAVPNAYSQFMQIQAMLPDDLKLQIMLCRSGEEICSGLIWNTIGRTGIELFAATSDAGTQKGGSHLMHWHLVERLKQQGADCYDLNGIDPATNPGTYRFKKDLAGRHGHDVFYLGKFDATAGPLSQLLIQLRDIFRIYKKRFAWPAVLASRSA